MEASRQVGIALSPGRAVVVGIRTKGAETAVVGAFLATVEPDAEDAVPRLAKQIADGCADHGLRADEAVLSLDSALTMQHRVHSEFQASKQIAATVRFDVEEVLATDVSSLAVAFQIGCLEKAGAQIDAFTVEQAVLEPWILALQSHGIDPVAVVPDICSLGRYLRRHAPLPADGGTALHGILSRRTGYFLEANAQCLRPLRAFLLRAGGDRGERLQRELFTTRASVSSAAAGTVHVFDAVADVPIAALAERLGADVQPATCFEAAAAGAQEVGAEVDAVDFAVAMGAALMQAERGSLPDFRQDFMPFQGRRLRLQGALKWASLSVTVLLIAVGTYLQICTLQERGKVDRLWRRVADQYRVVLPGRDLKRTADPVSALKREINRLERTQGGQAGARELASVPARLTAVLQAFNTVAGRTDLFIDKLDISEKTITVVGSTSNRTSNLQFFQGVRNGGLDIIREVVETDPASKRSKFTIILAPKVEKKA